MPVYSMTGYASLQIPVVPSATGSDSAKSVAESEHAWQLALELRSVNSRFLDLAFRLSDELRPFESLAREQLQRRLHRGKLELRASLEYGGTASGAAADMPAVATLQRLASCEEAIRSWMPQAMPLSVADVLRIAGTARPTLPMDALSRTFASAVTALLDQMQQTRATEGKQLADSLLERVDALRTLAREAEPLIPQLVAQQKQRFLDRWNDALQTASRQGHIPETAEERALTEATAFAIRIDVAEELTRLQAHLDTIEKHLRDGGELGKRMEFLIQELHREANTLGSKSASLETSRISVDMKVLIEQMREQVQNIE